MKDKTQHFRHFRTSALVMLIFVGNPSAGVRAEEPNIIFIMGDDIEWFNIGAYHRGIWPARLRISTA